MNSNNFELIGKVNFIDMKALEKGGFIVKALLGVYLGKDKDGNSVYDSFEVTTFNDTAESFGNNVKKGDYVYVAGRMTINKYTNKDGKEVKNIQLIGNAYTLVEYDKDARDYVAKGDAAAVQTELPWKK